jgi:DNA-binding transcriptional ArsR family regulator
MQLLLSSTTEYCVSEIADLVGISQPLASQQLAYLQAHGLVEGHRMGQTTCYMVTDTPITKKIAQIIRILAV